ncbi:MAG: Proteasome subunit YC7alpha/Y8 (protease yscE subunit 7), partial [Paramarteilia canceri]
YAFNAVSNCSFTSLGLRTEEGAVLISHKNITSKMIDPDYIKHVKPVTERLGCAYAGHIPDCEYMHLNAIHESVKFFDKYGHGFDIVALTRRLNAINQVNTQSPRMRILAA